MSIAVIVLNYRTPGLTLRCLASLEREVDREVRVVVVDNASGDGSAERIERVVRQRNWSSWACVLRSSHNGGFAAGNNLGIRAIEADAYLLLNSDTLVRPGAIAALCEALRATPDAGIIGPQLLDEHGRPDQSFFRTPAPPSELLRGSGLGPLARLLYRYDPVLPGLGEDTPRETDWLAFACVLIRKDVIERVGLLDEGYFMYFEDVDYCRRARAAGFKVLYWPRAQVVHLRGGSSGVTAQATQQSRAPRYYYEARARYFAKFYGRGGLWLANSLWHLGRGIAWPRKLLGKAAPQTREREARDLWTRALRPLQAQDSGSRALPDDGSLHAISHAAPLPRGDRNANPRDIDLLALIAEDLRAHDGNPTQPGFWAVVVHRFGNARMSVRPHLLRAPLSVAYRAAFTYVNWLWGIELPYTVKLGRRVRIWHHGGIMLNARAIGDDVHIRHNTTLGIARRDENECKPIIGNRVDIGVGSRVLGAITVGDDCVIGANSVVIRSLPAGCTAVGVPARVLPEKSKNDHATVQQLPLAASPPHPRPAQRAADGGHPHGSSRRASE